MSRVIVVGGSIAGLCAARVLADHVERVTVIDRDTYPAGAAGRPGVPQARHVHALLARGRRELERLFPGFERLMVARGAHEIDFGTDFACLRPEGWVSRAPSGIPTLFGSRALLESIVRELALRHPRIELVERTAVTGLVAQGEPRLRVRGVRVAPADGGGPTEIAGDLVVDASGRGSRSGAWLRALGLALPDEEVVDSSAGYSTRWYRAPEPSRWPSAWWWKGIWIDPREPDHLSACVLFPMENGRWVVTLAGLAGHHPPGDEAGFDAGLAALRTPIVADAVRLAEPISPVYGSRAMANRFRHFERWRERLDGFLAVGDTVCAFNPVYGQGMTSAAISAGLLAESLAASGPLDPALPSRFFAAQAAFLREPYAMATSVDLRFPATTGARPFGLALAHRYFDALFATSMEDVELRRRVGEVINMIRPPKALFELNVLGRVARNAVRQRFAGPTPAAPLPCPPAA